MTIEELKELIGDLLWKDTWKVIRLCGDEESELTISRESAISLYLTLRALPANRAVD